MSTSPSVGPSKLLKNLAGALVLGCSINHPTLGWEGDGATMDMQTPTDGAATICAIERPAYFNEMRRCLTEIADAAHESRISIGSVCYGLISLNSMDDSGITATDRCRLLGGRLVTGTNDGGITFVNDDAGVVDHDVVVITDTQMDTAEVLDSSRDTMEIPDQIAMDTLPPSDALETGTDGTISDITTDSTMTDTMIVDSGTDSQDAAIDTAEDRADAIASLDASIDRAESEADVIDATIADEPEITMVDTGTDIIDSGVPEAATDSMVVDAPDIMDSTPSNTDCHVSHIITIGSTRTVQDPTIGPPSFSNGTNVYLEFAGTRITSGLTITSIAGDTYPRRDRNIRLNSWVTPSDEPTVGLTAPGAISLTIATPGFPTGTTVGFVGPALPDGGVTTAFTLNTNRGAINCSGVLGTIR